ncbi:MAG: hypothetical protein JST39_07355, partial [Bacteroidetes bacterium]|nr:hypothetical protein [Bacteroidota bacterium]
LIPTGVSAAAASPGQITCSVTAVTLSGSSATPNAQYSWTGPGGFTAGTANTSATVAGDYILTVTDISNGCTATATASVTLNNSAPAGVTAFSSDKITCTTQQIDLIGSSTTPNVTYLWTGANGYSANTATASTNRGGSYSLLVTNPANGCTKLTSVNVLSDTTRPANVFATNSGPLTCDITQVTISGGSSTPGADFVWNGPNGYLSFSAEDLATDPGPYVLTVTNLSNGCSVDVTTTVINNCKSERKAVGTPAEQAAATESSNGSFEYKAHPNPFSGQASVAFRTPVAAFVSIQLYNANGAVERTLFNGKTIAAHAYKLDITGRLSAGMHYLVMRVDDKIYTKPLVSL